MARQFQIAGMYWLDNSTGIEYQLATVYANEAAAAAAGGPFPWHLDDLSGGLQTLGMGTI